MPASEVTGRVRKLICTPRVLPRGWPLRMALPFPADPGCSHWYTGGSKARRREKVQSAP